MPGMEKAVLPCWTKAHEASPDERYNENTNYHRILPVFVVVAFRPFTPSVVETSRDAKQEYSENVEGEDCEASQKREAAALCRI